MRIATIIATASLAASQPAFAWDTLDDDSSCGFGQVFEGPGGTSIVFSQPRDLFDVGGMTIILGNANWSLREGMNVTDDITLVSESRALGNRPIMRDGALVLAIPYAAVEQFMESGPRTVQVMKGRQLIAPLDFSGVVPAWSLFNQCRQKWQAEKAEHDRLEALSKLPRDPFAGD